MEPILQVAFPGTPRFAVIRRIGRGGMGTVYEALDRERKTRVALKTLSTLNADTLLLFKNEFRALQDIQHPNLVRLGELFEEAGQWFFTMELVGGVDFMTYVNPQHDPQEEACTDREADAAHSLSAEDAALTASLDLHLNSGERPTPEGLHTAEVTSTQDLVHSTVADPDMRRPLSRAGAGPSAVPHLSHFDEPRLWRALGQLAQGVHALHSAQKIHRDLKPSNITAESAARRIVPRWARRYAPQRAEKGMPWE